jgi:heterodisulfide reductase subunit B
MQRYSYYPGCSLHATGKAYDASVRATFRALGAELVEIEDWNCCGATAYMSVRETVACAISARNLALAEKAGLDIVAPCSACFTVLNKTRAYVRDMPEFRQNIETCLQEAGLTCRFDLPVRHPLEVIVHDFGARQLAAARVRDLAGLRVACYYGCQIVRPERAVLEDAEQPMALDDLMASLGAAPTDFPPKVRCCGGMLVATNERVAQDLCRTLWDWARAGSADCIVTTCPLCHANLELLQQTGHGAAKPMPIVYFTQLVGLALGCDPHEVGLQYNLVPLKHEFPRMAEAVSHG